MRDALWHCGSGVALPADEIIIGMEGLMDQMSLFLSFTCQEER